MKKSTILGLFAIVLISTSPWALEDTPANRSKEVDRLISRDQLQEGMQQAIDHMAQVIPIGLRKTFKNQMIMSIDITALEKAMREGMSKHFTADEIQALADSQPSSVGGSLEEKREAYTLEVMHAFSQALDAALAKVKPEMVKWVSGDDRLRIRVKELHSAMSENDSRTQYKMLSPPVGRKMTFEAWKKDLGLDVPKQIPTGKGMVRADLEKVCSCRPWVYGDQQETFRCTILVRVATESIEGDGKPHRLLEMWEYVDGEWYHGYTDHHRWEDCPK
jgi:hypothetical protein